jgi:hypothetical protein
MPQRNGPRSNAGRSAIARRVLRSGSNGATNGIIPQVSVVTSDGKVIRHAGYFGGPKKGGSAPSATGFMRPSSSLNQISSRAKRPNYLFTFKTNPGPSPFGNAPLL